MNQIKLHPAELFALCVACAFLGALLLGNSPSYVSGRKHLEQIKAITMYELKWTEQEFNEKYPKLLDQLEAEQREREQMKEQK